MGERIIMIELSVMMPCYKEADNLKILLPKIDDVLSGFPFTSEIIIVDTQTPMDDTAQVCEKFRNVRYVPRNGGNDYGDAVRTGIKSTLGRYVLIMDADGSHNPEDITRLYDDAGGCDVVTQPGECSAECFGASARRNVQRAE